MSEDDVPASDAPDDPADGGLLVEVDAPDPAPVDRATELEAELAASKAKAKENWDKFLRATADLENYRRRAKRDLDDAKAESRTRVLKEMLPVVDNLERALAHTEGVDAASLLEGVRLVLRQFTHALEKCEVTAIDADGQPFDPNLHEAIGQQDSDAPPGSVVSVLQKGYRLADRLLRPSLVVVARARAEAPPSEPGPAENT
ncbi:MAG: nucleotide exchange factor GrpE [Myxococcales bacterium]|nr:nucleotide exchange factor GrpE [Myxococcales bacterium]